MDATKSTLFFWIPVYEVFKLIFIIFLWHPWSRGAAYIYDNLLASLLTAGEAKIGEVVDTAKKSLGKDE
jgi:hypothetical protein